MSPIDLDLVQRKLKRIAENLSDLETVEKKGLKSYKADRLRRKLAERLVQEVIEAASDINFHILTEKGRSVPDDYYSGFVQMGEIGVFPPEFATKIAPSAGLRNRIVHGYDALDDKKVFQGIQSALKLFPQYIHSIQKFAE